MTRARNPVGPPLHSGHQAPRHGPARGAALLSAVLSCLPACARHSLALDAGQADSGFVAVGGAPRSPDDGYIYVDGGPDAGCTATAAYCDGGSVATCTAEAACGAGGFRCPGTNSYVDCGGGACADTQADCPSSAYPDGGPPDGACGATCRGGALVACLASPGSQDCFCPPSSYSDCGDGTCTENNAGCLPDAGCGPTQEVHAYCDFNSQAFATCCIPAGSGQACLGETGGYVACAGDRCVLPGEVCDAGMALMDAGCLSGYVSATRCDALQHLVLTCCTLPGGGCILGGLDAWADCGDGRCEPSAAGCAPGEIDGGVKLGPDGGTLMVQAGLSCVNGSLWPCFLPYDDVGATCGGGYIDCGGGTCVANPCGQTDNGADAGPCCPPSNDSGIAS